MGLGILESKSEGDVPGTTRYCDDDVARRELVSRDGVLKYDTNGSTPVILIPQPSDDPNDPLNCPLWRRDLITLVLCLPGVLSICLSSIMASNTLIINAQFGISLDKAAVLTGYFLLALASVPFSVSPPVASGWTFNFVAILTAISIPAVVFFCPETAFRRDSGLGTEEINVNCKSSGTKCMSAATPGFVLPPISAAQPVGNSSTPKKRFLQTLSIFDGRKTDKRFLILLWRPFPLLLNPALVWACLIQGVMIGWTVFIGVIIATYYIGPLHFWTEVEAGYTYAGPSIGAFTWFAIAGALADSSVRFLTKRKKGIYEPEFLILLVIPMLILGCIGLYGFGLTLDGFHNQYAPVVFGLEVAGMVIGTVASSLYIADAYRESMVESFTLMIIFKNVFSFILTLNAFE